MVKKIDIKNLIASNSYFFKIMKKYTYFFISLIIKKQQHIMKSNTLSAPTTQKSETVVINGKNVELSVGMGATSSYGSDCYPHTVWGWRTTKGGKVFVYLTSDNYEFVKAANWTPGNMNGAFVYSSQMPSAEHPAHEVQLTHKNCRTWVGSRRYYQDPSF